MFEDQDSTFRPQTLLFVLGVAKLLETASLYTSYGYLRLLNYPSTFWAWLLLSGSSVLFILLQQPWRGRMITPPQWIEIVIYSILQALHLVSFCVGLKYFGPLRTFLFSDFADITYVFIAGIFFQQTREKMHLNRKRGILLLVIGYSILFFVDESPVPEGIEYIAATTFSFGSLSLSASKGGCILLFVATCVAVARKKMAKTLGYNIGGTKRLNALSTLLAAIVLTPFALYSWMDAAVLSVGHWFHFFEAIGFCIVVFMAVAFYVDVLVKPQLRSQHAMPVSLGSSVLACFLLDTWYGDITFSLWSIFAFMAVCTGQVLMFQAPTTSTASFGKGIEGSHNNNGSLSTAVGPLLQQLFTRIKENKDARNIFIYLCLNLMFMFVEMLYGVWCNSLGLISDGFHMLFDCIALLIGLVALVISEWQPNKTYTYGYLRVNILSGFINAIFLVFIACSVFYEAIHRFIEPATIDTDNLLLVSVLGLLVNLVGLFVFSQAHHAAHGHSHSHGHSHASHDEEESHGHAHAHGHGEQEEEDEHEDENMKGVFLHILGDTLGSVGVIISSLCIEYFNWTISDPICSIIIAFFIFTSVIPLLKSSATILLQVTPKKAERKLPKCLAQINSLPGVQGYTEPHFWSTDGNEVIGTIHIQTSSGANTQEVLQAAQNVFSHSSINQVTIQIDQNQDGVESLITTGASW